MPLPFMDGTAKVTTEPVRTENRHGTPTLSFDLKFKSTKMIDGKAVDGDFFEIAAKAFGDAAEDLHLFGLIVGDEIVVKGRLKSDVLPTAIGRVVVPILFLDSVGESITRKYEDPPA